MLYTRKRAEAPEATDHNFELLGSARLHMRTDYHLQELQIALSPADPRRIVPDVTSNCHSVLDVGCGAGQTLIGLKLAPTTLVIGVDDNLEALQLGKQLAPQIHFVCAKGEALPFSSGAFDLAISRLALFYMNIPIAIGEAARVLNNGGKLWCVLRDKAVAFENLSLTIRSRNSRAFLFELYAFLNGLIFHLIGRMVRCPFSKGRYASFQTSSRIKRTLGHCGFTQILVCGNRHLVTTAIRDSAE